MGLDFCAIDFETASWDRASAIQVGIVRYRDGVCVDTYAQLIAPPEGFDEFSDAAIAIHHITPDMVETAPSWGNIYRDVCTFIAEDRLVSYNARFDGQVFASASLIAGIPDPRIDMGCALTWSQHALLLPNHKLPTVAAHFGVDLTNHHDAVADAFACAEIVVALANLYEVDSIDDLAIKARGPFGTFQPDKNTMVAYLERQQGC